MTLSFFSSREIAEAFHGEAATGGQPFEMTAATIHRVSPDMGNYKDTPDSRGCETWGTIKKPPTHAVVS